jgi:O-antigen ligase
VVVAERGGSAREAAFGATNARLSDVGGHRLRYWRVAIDVAADHPIAGAGPGAFAVEWLRRRTIDERVRNAHSLELQTLADLGIVGLALLAAAIAATALAAAGALRADRALAAGPIAGALTWALHAGLDWDWEMPGVTLPFLALTGAALGVAAEREVDRHRREHDQRRLGPDSEARDPVDGHGDDADHHGIREERPDREAPPA